MGRRLVLASICLPAVMAVASCGGGGGGGSPTGSGGATGTGGNSGAGNGLGTGKGFAFPQNKATGQCMLTGVASASSLTQAAYDSWKSNYVASASPGLRVRRPENSNDTVSEGIGYGMLAAVYMNDQATFDGIWTFAQAHLDGTGLMNWHLNADGSTASGGAGSATDADEDIAFALLMASDQWHGGTYLDDGVKMVNAMRSAELFTDGSLQNGDTWSFTNALYPDYFSPAYYRVFAKAANDTYWVTTVIEQGYSHLAAVSGNNGLVPNSTNLQNSLTASTCNRTNPTYTCDLRYGYDACRTPWRIGMDYCWNNEPRALAYLMKIGGYFDSNGGVASIGDGYTSPDGPKSSPNQNSAFIGPAGVAGMAAGFAKLRDDAFSFNNTNSNNSYFAQSLRVLSMLMMSGNMLDYSQM